MIDNNTLQASHINVVPTLRQTVVLVDELESLLYETSKQRRLIPDFNFLFWDLGWRFHLNVLDELKEIDELLYWRLRDVISLIESLLADIEFKKENVGEIFGAIRILAYHSKLKIEQKLTQESKPCSVKEKFAAKGKL